MIRVQYFVNAAFDLAVTMSDISEMCTAPPILFAFWGFWGPMDLKQPLKFNYFYLWLIGHLNNTRLFIVFQIYLSGSREFRTLGNQVNHPFIDILYAKRYKQTKDNLQQNVTSTSILVIAVHVETMCTIH